MTFINNCHFVMSEFLFVIESAINDPYLIPMNLFSCKLVRFGKPELI